VDNDEVSITYKYTNNLIFELAPKKYNATSATFMYPDYDNKMGTKWFYELKDKLTLNF
jgi:hypothetical protein